MKKKVCIVTGTRADYGLLYGLIKRVHDDNDLELQLVVSCMHLSPEFGFTCNVIEKDGFPITRKVEMLLSADTESGVAKSTGMGVIRFSDIFSELQPDLLLGLGDRFELLSAVTAALFFRIPVAHLHGGESTEGAIDEAIRHSITKMSHLHFTATESYRRTVIQLGEQPSTVFNVGAIGVDNIKSLSLLGKSDLESQLNIKFHKKNLLITFHPETLEPEYSATQLGGLLGTLDCLEDTCLFFTSANADPGGRVITQMVQDYVKNNKHKAWMFVSLGQLRYLSLLKAVDAVVGNSSSGIIEAPSLKTGTINIGSRQQGRVRASSVIDCSSGSAAITEALDMLYSTDFQVRLAKVENPYGEGGVTEKVISIIKKFLDEEGCVKKSFYQIEPQLLGLV